MRNILLVIKNNLIRLSKEKFLLVMLFIVLPLVVYLGIYFSDADIIEGKLAVTGGNKEEIQLIKEIDKKNNSITIDFLNESPTKTELVKGIYLAEIQLGNEENKVISYGNKEVKKSLEACLKGEVYGGSTSEGTIQGKIIGFLTMFLFMGSVMIMDFFLDDRDNGVYMRVLEGGISYYEYIIGQMLYAVSVLTLPSIILSLIVVKIITVDITISLLTFAGLILLVGLLSSSFAVTICTLFKNRIAASINGSNITLITCLLGGCLINISDSNKIISFIRDFIPQKRLIDFANTFNETDLIFVIIIIIMFILISVFLGKKQYENGEFA